MKVHIIIPTTGQRPQFLEMALALVGAQMIPAWMETTLEVINEPGPGNTLVKNYRKGITQADADMVLPWEDDDYYPPDYAMQMAMRWRKGLDFIGINETTYYHLAQRKWTHMVHQNRSSMMGMAFRPGVELPWEPEQDPFLDIRIWQRANQYNCDLGPGLGTIGIKHGVGPCGGRAHNNEFKYENEDQDMEWLKARVRPEAFKFYQEQSLKLRKKN